MAEDNISIPEMSANRVRSSEIGYSGLNLISGRPIEECQKELQWPYCIYTFKQMAKDGTIAPALAYFETMISAVPWDISIPLGYEKELEGRKKIVKSMMSDMEHSWLAFIKQIVTFNRFGFAVSEIVPRRRLKRKGSHYNDGLWGIRKLPLISQDSVLAWDYDAEYHRDLVGVKQLVGRQTNFRDINGISPIYNYDGRSYDNYVTIPRDSFLLFRNNPLKDNPEGTSILSGAWKAWKYKQAYEATEAEGVSQDVQGFKVLYLPPEYMTEDATDGKKAIFETYKQMLKNAASGKNGGFVLPQVVDINGNKSFEFDILNQQGTKSYDVNAIIARLQKEMLTSLFADFLTLGQSGGGSFSLATNKQSMTSMVIEAKLTEIKDVLNHYLIPKIYEWNGWEDEVRVEFTFGDVDSADLDVVSKALQRTAATGLVAKTPKNINAIAEILKLPERVPEDMSQEELNKILGADVSRSGDGLSSGMPSGVGSNTGSSGDSSSKNSENK